MTEADIQQLIAHRPQPVSPMIENTDEARQGSRTTSRKRKRMATSASSRSISQRRPKRSRPQVIEQHDEYVSKYLMKKPQLLFQMLRLHLNYPFKGKQQRQFIHRRLHLHDRQYRLDLHRHLWQSYREWGANHEMWPVSPSLSTFFSSSHG